ncbi:MAG: sugar-binding protein [Lentisphaeria bacterium]
MRAFIDYTEKNWPLTRSKPEVIGKIFELITAAREAAGPEGLYRERIQLIIDYMEPLKGIREQLKVGRKENPVAAFAEVDETDIKLDGRLNESVWDKTETYELKDIVTGEDVENGTTFSVAWAGDSLYFGIRCEEPDMDKLAIPAKKSGDLTLFDGDSVEILLETPSHAYYQIAIDPKGHVNDLDRPNSILIGKTGKYKTEWEAGATVATNRGKNFWSIEARIPAMGANQEKILADFGVSGDKPTKDRPWYFNVCRSRKVDMEKRYYSAFSPTGEHGFHYMRGFAKLIPQ